MRPAFVAAVPPRDLNASSNCDSLTTQEDISPQDALILLDHRQGLTYSIESLSAKTMEVWRNSSALSFNNALQKAVPTQDVTNSVRRTVGRIFFSTLTLRNTSTFFTRSVQLKFSILSQHHISKNMSVIWAKWKISCTASKCRKFYADAICTYSKIYIYIYIHNTVRHNFVFY